MATLYASGALWNTASNWGTTSGASDGTVPTASDDTKFDANSISMAIDVNAVCQSIDSTGFTATLTKNTTRTLAISGGNLLWPDGTIDFIDGTATVTGGNTTLTGTIEMGTCTLTIDGDFTNVGSTFQEQSSKLIMTGTGKTFSGSTTTDLSDFTVALGATITSTTVWELNGIFDVIGQFTQTGGRTNIQSPADLQIQSTGKLTGSGTLRVKNNAEWSVNDGICDISKIQIQGDHDSSGSFVVAGTFESLDVEFFSNNGTDREFVPQSGAYIFNGGVTFEADGAGSITITNSTNNPNFVFKGSVSLINSGGGGVVWTKGTGTITLSGAGSGTQTIDFLGKTVEEIIINDSGATKQFTANVDPAALTHTDGVFDPNGKTFTLAGDYTGALGKSPLKAGAEGATFNVGGNLLWVGNESNILDMELTADMFLNVTGTADVSWGKFANVDASGGSIVQAMLCYEGANVDNFNFTDPEIGQHFLNGDIAEILVYDTALSDNDRQKVEGYLAWKWGLVAGLPVGHPYKDDPPE